MNPVQLDIAVSGERTLTLNQIYVLRCPNFLPICDASIMT